MGEILLHKGHQPHEPGAAPLPFRRLLFRDLTHGQAGEEEIENLVDPPQAVQLVEGRALEIAAKQGDEGGFQPGCLIFGQMGGGKDGLSVHPLGGGKGGGVQLEAQKGAAALHLVKLMGLAGAKQHQLPRLHPVLLSAAGHQQRLVQHPHQLPVQVDVEGAVVQGVEKQMDAPQVGMLDNFQGRHRPHLPNRKFV